MADKCDVGDLMRCEGTFLDLDDVAVDPSAVFFKFKDPSGNVTSYTYPTDGELVKEATGLYYVDVDVDEGGDWWFRFFSTGSGQAAGEGTFWAEPSEVD